MEIPTLYFRPKRGMLVFQRQILTPITKKDIAYQAKAPDLHGELAAPRICLP